MEIVVGTAGHIDHGKTALVKALTGTDTDRLPEEKRRGITIDIGFADMRIDDVGFSFVDVPGHERFVKNMLAGATGIDLVLLVIASDEGVMPQTREHFEICRLLDVKRGLVVLTKTDLVDAETLKLARLEATELVENSFLWDARIIETSARSGVGIEELKQTLLAAAHTLPGRRDDLVTMLPVDRVFTVKGFGTVVTGTLAAGQIRETDDMELLPDGRKVRVRGLQTHGKPVHEIRAGQRTAVNLAGIDHLAIRRGVVLTEPGVLRPTRSFDAEVQILKKLSAAAAVAPRVRVHVGTEESLARVRVLNTSGEIEPGTKDFAQLRLEMPVVVMPGERFIIRAYSPALTIGGGIIADAAAPRHRSKQLETVRARLSELVLSLSDPPRHLEVIVKTAPAFALDFADLQAVTGWKSELLKSVISDNITNGSLVGVAGSYSSSSAFQGIRNAIMKEVSGHHAREPLSAGIQREVLRERVGPYLPPEVFRAILVELEQEGNVTSEKEVVRSATYKTDLSEDESRIRKKLIEIFHRARFDVPKIEEVLREAANATGFPIDHLQKVLRHLVNTGEIKKVSEEFYFEGALIDDLIRKIRDTAFTSGDRLIDVPKFKEIAGVSRKYAIPLLEYFDLTNITRRAGDKRVIL